VICAEAGEIKQTFTDLKNNTESASVDSAYFLATWKAEIRRLKVKGQPGQMICKDHTFKITRAKWTGGLAQAWSTWKP
jgi:hypothetical protein